MNLEAINNMRGGLNARPPSNHKVKIAQGKSLSSDIEKFLSGGGAIEEVASIGSSAKTQSYNAWRE